MQTRSKAVQAAALVDELSQLKRRFERWRAGREVGQRIPSQLWDDAVGAVAGHGAYRVARELNLDYAVLKRRAAQAGGRTRCGGHASPRFIELFGPAAAVLPAQGSQMACVVEMGNAVSGLPIIPSCGRRIFPTHQRQGAKDGRGSSTGHRAG